MSRNIQSVLNFGFRSLVFVLDLAFDAWNFHDFYKRVNLFIPSNFQLKWRGPVITPSFP